MADQHQNQRGAHISLCSSMSPANLQSCQRILAEVQSCSTATSCWNSTASQLSYCKGMMMQSVALPPRPTERALSHRARMTKQSVCGMRLRARPSWTPSWATYGVISWVSSVAFSPDGTPIVSGSHDNLTIRVWDEDRQSCHAAHPGPHRLGPFCRILARRTTHRVGLTRRHDPCMGCEDGQGHHGAHTGPH
jgi:WD40 repeat protein